MRVPRFAMAAALAVLAVAACGSARAREGRIEDGVYALEDTIQVSGERLQIDPLRVPVAASLIRSSEWSTTRHAGMDEAMETVPGVIAQTRSGGQDVRVTIRGFGARGAGERSNAGTTRGIRVSLDGFPLTEPDGRTSLDLADVGLMSAIRIVRSNTSGLYGPASGGQIDLYSTPGFNAPFAAVRAEGGSFGYARQQAEAGFLSGSSRFHFAASTSNFDGWRTHSGGAQTTILGSIQASLSQRTALGLFLAGTRNLQRQSGALTQAEYDADPRQADPAYAEQNARRDNRIGRIGARLDHQLENGQSLRVGGFVEPKTIHRSERNRYRDFQRVHTGGSALYSIPVRLGAREIRWTNGIDEAYQDGSVLFYSLGPDGTRGDRLVADQREGINTFGAFTEVNVTPSRRWEGTIGARWDFVHFISEDHATPALNDARTLDRVSPRAAISFRLDPEHSFYAALSSGIETPAFNEIDPPAPFDTLTSLNPFLEPAYSITYEIGAKGSLHFGRGFDVFHYDVALYTLEVKNEIVPWDGGAFYRTAGKSRRSGIEFGLSAATDYGLSARTALTASHNRYIDYQTGAPDAEGHLVTVRYDDNESAGIPATVLNASVRYEHPFGPFIEGSYRWVSEYFANDANTDRVPAYNLVDVTIGARRRFDGTEVGVFISGRNLANEKYAASAYVNGVNGRFIEPGMERNLLIGVDLRRAAAGGR